MVFDDGSLEGIRCNYFIWNILGGHWLGVQGKYATAAGFTGGESATAAVFEYRLWIYISVSFWDA